jgi:hypothetical protein
MIVYKLTGALMLVLLVAGCDANTNCPAPPANETLIQFVDRNAFGLGLLLLLIIWAVERMVRSFSGHPKTDDESL